MVFADTSEMCMIKKPITLKANARFKTVVMKMKHHEMDVINAEPNKHWLLASSPQILDIAPQICNKKKLLKSLLNRLQPSTSQVQPWISVAEKIDQT